MVTNKQVVNDDHLSFLRSERENFVVIEYKFNVGVW